MVLQQVKICHELGDFYSLSSRDLNMVGNNVDEWDRFLVIPYRDGIIKGMGLSVQNSSLTMLLWKMALGISQVVGLRHYGDGNPH